MRIGGPQPDKHRSLFKTVTAKPAKGNDANKKITNREETNRRIATLRASSNQRKFWWVCSHETGDITWQAPFSSGVPGLNRAVDFITLQGVLEKMNESGESTQPYLSRRPIYDRRQPPGCITRCGMRLSLVPDLES